ncbi:MAG: hypothetical protein P4L84_22090 [Isosphaeraceae bacterium]|nr:hypothetical protein [Isosphaeraceae bacterium]
MKAGAKSELTWLAMSYVCGDLPAEDVAAFEQRLEQDQAAREAVALAVELAGAVAQLPPDQGPRLRPRRPPALAALPRWAGIAAAVLLLALAAGGLTRLPESVMKTRHPGAPSPGLALAWSGVHRDEADTDDLLDWLDVPSSSAEASYLAAIDSSDAADAGIPDWMLEAALLNGGVPVDQPARKEN